MNTSDCLWFPLCGHVIKDLNMFEIRGMQPAAAHGTVIQIFTSILVINTTVSQIVDIKFFGAPTNQENYNNHILVGYLCDNELPLNISLPIYITIVNRTAFNGITLFQAIIWPPANFSTTVTNSWFNDQSSFIAQSAPNMSLKNYVRELIIQNCTVSDSLLELLLISSNITIFNSTLRGNIGIFTSNNSTLEIIGAVLFSNTDQCESSSANFYSSSSSNVKITGNVIFADSIQTSISVSSSTITLSGNISFLNNVGVNGGAMALYSSTLNIAPNTSVYFYNNTAISGGAMALYHFSTMNIARNTSIWFYDNTATETGGAIFVDNNVNSLSDSSPFCFYQLLDYCDNANLDWYSITFYNNSATNGGDDIYGEFMHSVECYAYQHISSGKNGGCYPYDHTVSSCCVQKYFHYDSKSVSSVSSDSIRVCLCKNGGPQCSESNLDIKVYPGETFTLSTAIVGADFGATVGSVHAVFKNPTTTVQLKPSSQYIQGIREIGGGVCSELYYTVFSTSTYETLMLLPRQESWISAEQIQSQSYDYHGLDRDCNITGCNAEYYVRMELLLTQLLLNVSLLPCPLGFQLKGDPPGCECHPVLTKNNVKCQFINHTGYHIWSGPLWLNIDNVTNLYLAQNCPFDYCISNTKIVDFQNDSSAQCAFNRTGRLCGGCKDNYSLAIGSSHCIYCPNNNNLGLLIFFAAAGILLVAIIGVFNLTVFINGLVFYANVVWTYQKILLSQQVESNFALTFLRTSLAWINLDFGINTYFAKGLNALHKTWPQYLFILYIWGIAIAIIFASRHSTKLTKILGDRPVPVLVTLFLLSYTKLLQIIIDSVGFTQINVFGVNNSKKYVLTVWSLDGNCIYCHYPHVLLFIAALLVFFTVWLPYTLVMLSVQWLRKISHLKLFKFDPIFDAHLGQLKDEHHYWFGVLLIVRGLLLVIFTLTYTVYPNINYIVLLITASLLLFYSNYHGVYKNRLVQLSENFFLFLLILIGATGILEEQTRRIVVYALTGVGLLAFCGTTVGSRLFRICLKIGKTERDCISNEPRRMQQQISDSVQSRDAILDEMEPLLGDTESISTY